VICSASKGSCSKIDEAKRSLRVLLLGKDVQHISNQSEIRKFDKAISDLFVAPLVKEIEADGKADYMVNSSTSTWSGVKSHSISSVGTDVILARGAHLLQLFNPPLRNHDDDEIISYDSAKRYRTSESGNPSGRSYPHDCIYKDCVVQVLLHGYRLETPALIGPDAEELDDMSTDDTSWVIRMYVVLGIIGRRSGAPWAVVQSCKEGWEGSVSVLKLDRERSPQILQLQNSVRRACVQHACDRSTENCLLNLTTRVVHHSHTLGEGGTYYFRNRGTGYPPRMA